MSKYKEYICNNCNAKLYVNMNAYFSIIAYLDQIIGREIGGILIGHYSSSLQDVYINELSYAPDDSKSGYSWFVRGIKGISEYLKKIWDKKEEYYLGEWHFHPANIKMPSSKDIMQMQEITRDKRFNCKEPLLFLFSRNNKGEYHLDVSLFIGSTIFKFYEK
ncbi:Mov34/MPN/PAD-1 family protein [Faecalimonas sp.]